MMARIAGSTDSSLMADLDPQQYGVELRDPSIGGYLATTDGPRLVALVAEQQNIGESLLERYLNVHRAYGYPQYRNESL
jgi:hypothetical protein